MSFTEFWPYYVGQHRRPACRALHYLAALIGLAVLVMGLVRGEALFLVLAPVAGYSVAWLAHFCVEGNDPATFRYVRWSFLAEFKMLGLGLTGRMDDEVRRLYGSSAPAPDAPLRVEN